MFFVVLERGFDVRRSMCIFCLVITSVAYGGSRLETILETIQNLLVMYQHCIGPEEITYGSVELGICVVSFAKST
jgi:hypothetical protein